MEPVEVPLGTDLPSPFKRPAQNRPPTVAKTTSLSTPSPAGRLTTSPFPTLAAPPASTATTEAPAPASTERQELETQCRRGAFWFYWVAGLSLVNSALAFAGQDWRFIIGLGMTQIVDALAAQAGRGWTAALLFDALLMGGFVLLGALAVRGHASAFIAGIGLYSLDGLISIVVRDWIGLGFHAFVVFMVFKGFRAARQLTARAT
jgi:hypothetical protein